LKNGTVSFDFESDVGGGTGGSGGSGGGTVAKRDVEIRMSSEADKKYGPFVILWHSYGQDGKTAIDEQLGSKLLDEILASGGVVASPAADPTAGSGSDPWFYTLGGEASNDDLVLMDQVLACAIEQTKVDTSHIHTIGYAEGASQAAQAAARRSNYIASIVTHSVFFGGAPEQDGDNAYAVMILHGGTGDTDGIDYEKGSNNYAGYLTDKDDTTFEVEHLTVICNHDLGHQVDAESLDSSWKFLQDHPYGTDPSPYVKSNLPGSFPDYCTIQE